MMKNKSLLVWLGFCCLFVSQNGHAWGERGHHLVATTAARLVADFATDPDYEKGIAKFFADRSIQLGHLSNIPDTSWKNSTHKRRISRMNSSNHYFGPERLLGVPGENWNEYLEQVRNLPADYSLLKERYEGTQNKLPGVPEDRRTLRLYGSLGTTPYRAQQLYDLLVESFRCAKQKEHLEREPFTRAYPTLDSPFLQPEDGLGESEDPPLPSYICQDNLGRKSDLYAAEVIAGILAHFVGDQGQPYHPTADHDGWVTGNGGIHVYFESLVVQALDEKLNFDVIERARNLQFQQKTWNTIQTDMQAVHGVGRLLIHMAADSIDYKDELRQIDDNVAIVREKDKAGKWVHRKSSALAWGDHPRNHERSEITRAVRLVPSDPAVLAGFRPLIVDRIAVSAIALARVWVSAWEQAGRPDLSDQNAVSLSYPHDPPFIWPDFDMDALDRSRAERSDNVVCQHSIVQHEKRQPLQHENWWKSVSKDLKDQFEGLSQDERDDRYPPHWWKPVPREDAASWEVLPQDAGPGEVILSKRNELGVLSNFSLAPFVFRERSYQSLEGFWQMMKYPEDEQDERYLHPDTQWNLTREQVSQMVGFDAKRAGDQGSLNMKTMGIDWVSFERKKMIYRSPEKSDHYHVIFDAMAAKLCQNENVRRILLQTGDLILRADHNQRPNTPPAWKYYQIWMELRDQLSSDPGFCS